MNPVIVPPYVYPGPGAAVPVAYIARSSGAVARLGADLHVPQQTAVIDGTIVSIEPQTLTPDTPGRTLLTFTDGVLAILNQPAHMALLKITIANESASAISGTIKLAGLEERSLAMSEDITVSNVPASSSVELRSLKYFSEISNNPPTYSTAVTGTLGGIGVTITVEELQFRGHLKITSDGVKYAWDDLYTENEAKLATFEVSPTEVISTQDWRSVGPLTKRNRLGSEVVDWSGGSAEGPPDWLSQCVYTLCEGLDGHIFIAGNSGLISEWDGDRFTRTVRPSILTLDDHIISSICFGKNQIGHEIFFFGTSNGIIFRWDRSSDTYAKLTAGWPSTIACNALIKAGTGNSYIWALGTGGYISLLNEIGSTATSTAYGSNASYPANDRIYGAAYFDRHLYLAGGGSTYMRFFAYNLDSVAKGGIDLTNYLPGTPAERGRTVAAAANQINAVAARPDGTILLCGNSLQGFYIAQWNTRQVYPTGPLQFTTSAAVTIPAGTEVTTAAGAKYVTLEPITASGAGTWRAGAVAQLPGLAGMAVENTVDTLTTPITGVTAVTNPEPFGFGTKIATPNNPVDALPHGLLSTIILDCEWVGSRFLLTSQNSNVISYDGQRFADLTDRFEFKGRVTRVLAGTSAAWVVGDEGRVFSFPKC